MTEEITIDGVNVAGCEFLRNFIIPDNYGCKIDDSLCCDVGNCYYKQLQRLKQENEKLKESNKNIKLILEPYQKPEVVKVLTDWKTGELDLQEKRLDNYRKALEEIKIIADDTFKVCDDDCGNARKIKLIIDKINEVLK